MRSFWFHTWLLEAPSETDSKGLRVLFGGTDKDRAYFANRFFDGKPRETYQGRKWFREISSTARKLDCDLILTPLLGYLHSAPEYDARFAIPNWLTAEVTPHRSDVEEGRTKSRRRDIKQLQKHNLSYKVTTAESSLSHFYHSMYVPTMKASHSDGVLLMGFDHMMGRRKAGECELVVITHNDEDIAGSLIAYDQGRPRLWSEGILNADRNYLKLGTGMAIYLFSFRHLLENGHKTINVGRSRAFLSDGALYFKKRLGIEVSHATEFAYALQINNLSEGARECLVANPFIFLSGSELHAAVFMKANSLKADDVWTYIWRSYNLQGISQIALFVLDGQQANDTIRVPDQYAGRIQIRQLAASVPASGRGG